MPQIKRDRQTSLWKRLLIEPSEVQEQCPDPHPVFVASALVALVTGILGWVMASLSPGWIVPVCSFSSIVFGILGVRSKLRSVSVVSFVMGMFLLPNGIHTILRLLER